jgi:PilZ domain
MKVNKYGQLFSLADRVLAGRSPVFRRSRDERVSEGCTGSSAIEEVKMSERRVEERRRVLLSGRLVVGPSSTFDCIVRDRTEHGARLICRAPGIDVEVTLELKAAKSFRKRARIAWRRLEDCGVEFVEPESDPDAKTQAADETGDASGPLTVQPRANEDWRKPALSDPKDLDDMDLIGLS